MPNVVRFTLSTARTLHVPGAGVFIDGVLDVDANNLDLLVRTRWLVQPFRAVELGVVDSATPKPTLPAVPGPPSPDPYPQYLTPSEAAASPELRVALVPFWSPNEAVGANAVRVDTSGQTIKRISSGTTRASYDATEQALWTVTSGAGGGGGSTTDASLLTSGTLAPARIADGSLPIAKLAADIATQAELDAALGGKLAVTAGITVVNAGTNLSTARPAGVGVVRWMFSSGVVIGTGGVNVVNRQSGDEIFVAS